MKENLFARGPNEILIAIDTLDWAILVFTFLMCFQYVSRFR